MGWKPWTAKVAGGILIVFCTFQTVAARADEPPVAPKPRVPAGFVVKPGAVAETYSNTGWAKEIVHQKTGIEMVFVPAGEFTMGSPVGEKDRADKESQHRVRITKPFYMGKYEVTQGEWQKIMGNGPSHFHGSDRLPVEQVSWDDCQRFLRKTGDGLRLPTEAQWEYACRAGMSTPFNTGETIGTDEANFNPDYILDRDRKSVNRKKTVDVGSFRPNAFRLYDMHGNVWEWCSDWYDKDYYRNSPPNDPQGPDKGTFRVLRGGAWDYDSSNCRSAIRYWSASDGRNFIIGFRSSLDLK